jgi:hypothetical protein
VRTLVQYCCLLICLLVTLKCEAQYKGDHIPGFQGLQCGTEAPPGWKVTVTIPPKAFGPLPRRTSYEEVGKQSPKQ